MKGATNEKATGSLPQLTQDEDETTSTEGVLDGLDKGKISDVSELLCAPHQVLEQQETEEDALSPGEKEEHLLDNMSTEESASETSPTPPQELSQVGHSP